jgi:hypothetical protein
MRLLPHILAIVVFHACAFDMTPHGARVLRSASSSARRSIGAAVRHDHAPRRQRRCCLPQRFRQHSSWALAAASSSSSSSSETTSEEVLALEARIESLVGRKINVNSPKQVSLAVFGRVQSASRSVLEEAAAALASSSLLPHEVSGDGLSPTQREIASLVLRHRDLTRACGGCPSNDDPTGVGSTLSLSSASTMVSDIDEEESVSDSDFEDSNEVGALESNGSADAPRSWSDHGALSAQHHERAIRALFGRTGNQINRYWEEPLLELNRPSAKALVPQLDSTGCPMGFDPLARPFVVGSAIMSPELHGSDALLSRSKEQVPRCDHLDSM